jgi:hypothetical protein
LAGLFSAKPLHGQDLIDAIEKKPKQLSDRNWLLWGSLYATPFLIIVCYLNYVEPYPSGPNTSLSPWQLFLWGLLYLPIIVAPIAACWKVADFGFTLNPFLA